MSENKSIAINSIFLALRLIIVALLSLFSTKFLIKSLGVADFGLISITASLIFVVGIFNTIMTSTTFRFLAFELGKKNDKQINVVFNVAFSVHLCIGIVVLIAGEVFGINYIIKKINLDPSKISSAVFLFRFSLYALDALLLEAWEAVGHGAIEPLVHLLVAALFKRLISAVREIGRASCRERV